jgi:hypothetical protein
VDPTVYTPTMHYVDHIYKALASTGTVIPYKINQKLSADLKENNPFLLDTFINPMILVEGDHLLSSELMSTFLEKWLVE